MRAKVGRIGVVGAGWRRALLALMLPLAAGISGGCATSTVPRGEGANGSSAPIVEPGIPAPSAEEPVTVGAWITPGELAPGGTGVLVVRLRVAAGHHLYASGQAGAFTGTSVRMEEGGLVRPVADWVGPAVGGEGYLTGVVEFRRAVRVAEGAATGTREVGCAVTFQACTDEVCWPPRTVEMRVRAFVKAR